MIFTAGPGWCCGAPNREPINARPCRRCCHDVRHIPDIRRPGWAAAAAAAIGSAGPADAQLSGLTGGDEPIEIEAIDSLEWYSEEKMYVAAAATWCCARATRR